MKKLEISLGHQCNASCDFCYSAQTQNKQTMDTEKVIKILREYHKKGYTFVGFNGGEPTIRKDLFVLIKYAKKIGYSVELKTNLFLLSYQTYVNKLYDLGLDSIAFSIFSCNEGKYSQITGIKKSYQYVKKALDNLKNFDITLKANILISKYSYNELCDIINSLSGYPLSHIFFGYISTQESNHNDKDLIPKFSSFKNQLFSSIDIVESSEVHINIMHLPKCILEKYGKYYYNERMENITLVDKNSNFNLSQESFSDYIQTKKCFKCLEKHNCLGLRKDYYKIYGDFELKSFENKNMI